MAKVTSIGSEMIYPKYVGIGWEFSDDEPFGHAETWKRTEHCTEAEIREYIDAMIEESARLQARITQNYETTNALIRYRNHRVTSGDPLEAGDIEEAQP